MLLWDTKNAGRVVDEVTRRARSSALHVTVFAVTYNRSRVASATTVRGDACWDTSRGLAEAAATRGEDITTITTEFVADHPADHGAAPLLDGAAVRVMNDDVCMGAISVIGLNGSHGYALLRGVLINQGFGVSTSEA